jgi:hypothetical protein
MIGSSSCVGLGVVDKGLKNARGLDRGYLCVSSSGVVRIPNCPCIGRLAMRVQAVRGTERRQATESAT